MNEATKAAYLDQDFYESVFNFAVRQGRGGVLATLASIGYGDTLILSKRLAALEDALRRFSDHHEELSEQTVALETAIAHARDSGGALAFAGDMHPVLIGQ